MYLNKYKLISLRGKNLTDDMIEGYICHLYNNESFSDIGYIRDDDRVVIYSPNRTKEMLQYFKDRCPGLIEDQILTLYGLKAFANYKWESKEYKNIKSNKYNTVVNMLGIKENIPDNGVIEVPLQCNNKTDKYEELNNITYL